MSGTQKSAGAQIDVEEHSGVLGAFYFDHESKTHAVVIFVPEVFDGPLEYRVWRAQWPLNKEERHALLSEFDVSGKYESLSAEIFRSIPWGRMSATAKAETGQEQIQVLGKFEPPSEADVASVLDAGLLLGFRNKRDLHAHAAELRLLKPYLLALYRDKSSTAVEFAARVEGIPIGRARNLIVRAKSHGYLVKAPQAPFGELTDRALKLEQDFREALRKIGKDDRK